MKRYPTPEKPGHYWAKLVHPSGMPEGEDWQSMYWEVAQVHVNDNLGKVGDPEYLSVYVPGIAVAQWVEDFIWGPRIPDFRDEREQPGLTNKEQKAQGARCPCRGADDYCVCQNVTDATTRAERAQFGRR
jgi:hypothetical protein